MTELTIKTQKSARVYFSDEITQETEEVILACHGYAQLAKYFIKHFTPIASRKRVVVAPEGLSKFYWKGMSDRVVASWMTKEDREREIEDYINYLDQVVNQIQSKNNKVTLIPFGFSQGTATICRWIAKNPSIHFNQIVLWAGAIPEDVIENDLFKRIEVKTIIGNKDEYLSEDKIKHIQHTYSLHNVKATFHNFEGNHTINSAMLSNLFI